MHGKDLLYTRVAIPVTDFLTGKLPHVQPGVEMLFREHEQDIDDVHTDLAPEGLHIIADIGVESTDSLSEISEQEAQQRFHDPNIRARFEKMYAGTLNPQQIAWCRIAFPQDVLHTEVESGTETPHECEMNVQQGSAPNYLVAQDMAARHYVSMIALKQILNNSEPELAHAVQAELERTLNQRYSWKYSAPYAEISEMSVEDYQKVTACVQALRYFLPSNQICSQNFTAYGELSMKGIAYANPIGMDLSMRVVQRCVQSILPYADAISITSLNDFRDALSHQASLDKYGDTLVSQKTIQECIHKACEEWKQAAPDNLKPHIERMQQDLPKMIQKIRDEMTPESLRMRQIMSRASHIRPYDTNPHPSLHYENGVIQTYQRALLKAGYKMPGATVEQLISSALENTYQQARDTMKFHNLKNDYIAMATTAYVNQLYPSYATAERMHPQIAKVFQTTEHELHLPDDTTPKDVMSRIIHAAAAQIESITGVPQDQLPTMEDVQKHMYVPNHDLYLGYICGDVPVDVANELQARFDERFWNNELDDVLAQRNPNLDSDIALRAYTVWQLTKEMQREYATDSPEYAALSAIREASIANLHSRTYEGAQAEYHAALIEAFEQDEHDDGDIGDDTAK